LNNKFIAQFLDRCPAPAIGGDIQIVYDRVIATIDNMHGEEGVTFFKAKCKDYGQNKVSNEDFVTYLQGSFSKQQLVHLIPEVIKLLQDKEKRTHLWGLYQKLKTEVAASNSQPTDAPSLF
jgi:hypothetical protein